MSKDDLLEGYRGNENLDEGISELLIGSGISRGGDDLFDAAKQLNNAQAVQQFLKGAAGKLLVANHDEVLATLLRALTATGFKKKKIMALCMDYRISALSLGVLVQAVQEADEIQHRMEQEQIDDQPAVGAE